MHRLEAEKIIRPESAMLKRRGWEEENIIKLETGLIMEIARRDSDFSESTDPISVIVQVERSDEVEDARTKAISSEKTSRRYAIEDLSSKTDRAKNLKNVFEKIKSFAESESLRSYKESIRIQRPKKNWLTYSVAGEISSTQIKEIAKDPTVKRVESNGPIYEELDTSLNIIRVPGARVLSHPELTGNGVKVGVIDSEIARTHDALKNVNIKLFNLTDEPQDNFGEHGTHVAGIIASNDNKFRGVAPKVEIDNLKVFPVATRFKGIEAMQQAIENGCQILNLSFGAPDTDLDGTSALCTAVDNAVALGVCVIKSAGNSGASGQPSSITSPADAKQVIAVGSINEAQTGRSFFSSLGPTKDGRTVPHVLAPGEGINSTVLRNSFDEMMGTSMSAPHVTGIVALMLEANPNLKPSEVKEILMQKATKLPNSDKNEVGEGLVNAEEAVKAAIKSKNGGPGIPTEGDYSPFFETVFPFESGEFKIKLFRKS
jgi:subtilisin family serine protease